MGRPVIVGIDPDRVRTLATHLADVVDRTEPILADLRAATLAADLPGDVSDRDLLEIAEELGLLSTVLRSRAAAADEFLISLRPSWAGGRGSGAHRTPADDRLDELVASLVDDRGATAHVGGRFAIAIVLDHVDGDVVTPDDLRRMASSGDPVLRGAATWVADNTAVRTHIPWAIDRAAALPWSLDTAPIPVAALHHLLEVGSVVDALAPAAAHAIGGDGRFDDDDLRRLGIPPARLDRLGLPRDHDRFLAAAIELGAFDHAPTAARRLLWNLPIHHRDGVSLDIRLVSDEAVERLFETAVADLTSHTDDVDLLLGSAARLPESSGFARNRIITALYADLAFHERARLHDGQLVGALHPAFVGTTWFDLAAAASDTVGINGRGERITAALGMTDTIRQQLADGNQAIFHQMTEAWLTHRSGGTVADDRLAEALTAMDRATTAPLPEASELVLHATRRFAAVEQELVDPYLDLAGLGVRGTLLDLACGGLNPLCDDRGTVVTDVTNLEFIGDDGRRLREPLPLGRPIPGVDPDAGASRGVESWHELDQRMPAIAAVAAHLFRDPALVRLTTTRRTGRIAPPMQSPPPDRATIGR